MSKYSKAFLKELPPRKRAQYQKLIGSGKAYLERSDDGSQLLIITDPGGNDEAIWAVMPETGEARCVGNRVR